MSAVIPASLLPPRDMLRRRSAAECAPPDPSFHLFLLLLSCLLLSSSAPVRCPAAEPAVVRRGGGRMLSRCLPSVKWWREERRAGGKEEDGLLCALLPIWVQHSSSLPKILKNLRVPGGSPKTGWVSLPAQCKRVAAVMFEALTWNQIKATGLQPFCKWNQHLDRAYSLRQTTNPVWMYRNHFLHDSWFMDHSQFELCL